MEHKKDTCAFSKYWPIFGFMWAMSFDAMALRQTADAWVGINYQNYITEDKRWVFLIHNQLRFIYDRHPLRAILTEDSVGYGFNPKHRFWVGYYWSIHDPYHHDYQENRIWQQYYWKIVENEKEKVASRTRLEEIKFNRLSPNLIIFRQLFARETSIFNWGPVKPLVYEEIFLRLNHPSYSSYSFFNQNRVFLGVNIYCHDGQLLEGGVYQSI